MKKDQQIRMVERKKILGRWKLAFYLEDKSFIKWENSNNVDEVFIEKKNVTKYGLYKAKYNPNPLKRTSKLVKYYPSFSSAVTGAKILKNTLR